MIFSILSYNKLTDKVHAKDNMKIIKYQGKLANGSTTKNRSDIIQYQI